MSIRILRGLLAFLVAAGAAMSGGGAQAGHLDQSFVAGGVELHYGVMPAGVIHGYPDASPEHKMHGGPPRGRAYQHLMITLFDVKTRQRIENAAVRARVSEVGLTGEEKVLEPMTAGGAAAYGNYFKMSGPGPHRINVKVRRAGSSHVVEFNFDYTH